MIDTGKRGRKVAMMTDIAATRRPIGALVMSLLAAGLLVATPIIAQENYGMPQNGDRPAVCTFQPAVDAELARLPAKPSREDYEAAYLYAAGQSGCSTAALIEQLTAMSNVAGISPVQRQAILNVIAELRRQGKGTGAINDPALRGANFTSPLIGVGGGSATYTR
jgi:hypothetical protein